MDLRTVDWDGRQLQELNVSLLHKLQVQRVECLQLSRNGLRTLPIDIGAFLQQVILLDLQHNDLNTIPHCLLELPSLQKLNLSHNKITEIPDIPEWSSTLISLNLSHNQLQSLPVNTVMPSIETLSLSNNCLRYIPPCIFSFTTLSSLDLSDNPDILLPPYMKNSAYLTWIDPNIRLVGPLGDRKTRDIAELLHNKLYIGKTLYHIKILVVGMIKSGKSTLIAKLRNKHCNIEPTVGVDVNEWLYDPSFSRCPVHFTILEFGGLEDYCAAHWDFFSHNSIYLLLFNLKDGKKDLKVWLDNISLRAPHSHLVIVGTHLDEIPEDKDIGELLTEVKEVVHCYSGKLSITAVIPVGHKNTGLHKTTSVLKEVIYNCVTINKTSKEIVKQLVTNRNNPTELLQIVERADNLKECIIYIMNTAYHRLQLPQTRATLLMMKAAAEDDQSLILHLYGECCHTTDCSNEDFRNVQEAIIQEKVSKIVPFRMAQLFRHKAVQGMLLLKTNVNQAEGTVYWDGLQLQELDTSWLCNIYWVQRLRLNRNELRTLPNEMGVYLKQVIKLSLEYNDLTTIPHCLLELPSLQELNLSHNKITKIPNVSKCSHALTVLNLSHNQIQDLPTGMTAPSIRVLNLSHNHFQCVPICLCSFTTLHTLDLSDNPDIFTLPVEMGRLTSLSRLNLRGLKDLNNPPHNIQYDTRGTIRYLNSKLCGARGYYRIKLVLLGLTNRGKTTLVVQLLGKDSGGKSTFGMSISNWLYRPSFGKHQFCFRIWDLDGQEEYTVTHQCFLSRRSLYLILFKLTDGEEGVKELKPWLDSIAFCMPHSRVIIIGTHLDEIPDDQRDWSHRVLIKVGELCSDYCNKLDITEIIPVGLRNHIENISVLKEAIYNNAASYRAPRGGQLIMGQKIPASYHTLDKQLDVIQEEIRSGDREPIMHVQEFKTMVQQMNLADIQNADELKTATLFLTDVGSLLHYDDCGHNLNKLYFIDPCWLYKMMAKWVQERNLFVQSGILHFKDLPMIFHDNELKFLWKYYEQFLTLLDRFQIALPIDSKRILIPFMLPNDRPSSAAIEPGPLPLYSRLIIFRTANTPPGFWSRLLSQIMHLVPQICYCLDKFYPGNIQNGSSITLRSSTSSPSFLNVRTSQHVLPPQLQLSHIADTFDASQLQLTYWCSGLFYSDPEIIFCIESLVSSKFCFKFENDGVVIVTSPNNHGKIIIGQLVDIVTSLVSEWYPSLQERVGFTSGLEQRVPCYECLKSGVSKPFEFVVEKYLSNVTSNLTTIECGYNKKDPTLNHTVRLEDIVPDLLLQDINIEDIDFEEDVSMLLGEGTYGKVYRGLYGKEQERKKTVAIKKYRTHGEEAFSELRMEAKLLQKSHHPCVVCLVGVCIHPLMALVMEEAPLGSLEQVLIKRKSPVHRIVLYRIATEIVSALQFLHNTGVIFRDVKARNVLLWTLDPNSLCHAKLASFRSATRTYAIGAKGFIGTKGFIAPEVEQKQHSVYGHKADIFSFAMFLYQLITRRHPYHDLPPCRINSAVEAGDRPKLEDITNAKCAFHYLTCLMKACWKDNPCKRPSTDEIIVMLCHASVQSIMCVHPVRSRLSLRHVLAITPHGFARIGMARSSSELWVCCDGAEGAEINIYTTNTMVKVGKNFIKKNQVQCISLCGNYVWVASRAGIEYGVIDIFSIASQELVQRICIRENSVSAIASTEKKVYLGTLEGYVFAFNDINIIHQNSKLQCKYISEYAVDGIITTKHHCWVSHTCYIHFLNLENLTLEGSMQRPDGFIGQLSLTADGQTVWSAHLGGTMLSAWDAYAYTTNKFHINMKEHLCGISDQPLEHNFVITAMTPALDTVWVGMGTGHILVFHDDEVLTCYHPYKEYVRFICCIPCEGPCNTEECMVMSGGKVFQSPVPKIGGQDNYIPVDEMGQKIEKADNAGCLILWEAFSATSTKQIRMIEEEAPDFLKDHHHARMMLDRGKFKDGTFIMDQSAVDVSESNEDKLAQRKCSLQVQPTTCTAEDTDSKPAAEAD